MLDEIAHMTSLSTFTIVTIIVMCVICGFMVGQLLDSIPATIFVYFAFVGCTLISNKIWRIYELNFSGDRDYEAVMATTVGMVVGVVAFVTFKLVSSVVFGRVSKIPQTDLSAVYAEQTQDP